MKRFFVLTLAIIILFCSCAKQENVKTVSSAEIQKTAIELQLKKLEFGDDVKIKSIDKYCDELIIYSIDVNDTGKDYTIKIAISDESKDITDIKLTGNKLVDTICDSENEDIAPSVYIQNSGNEAKAIVYWNGYNFDVITEKVSTDELYQETIKLAKVISKDNIK